MDYVVSNTLAGMLVLFNKPYGVLSQFTSDGGRWKTLSEFIDIPNVYAAGRLDADSEGLLLLTDHGVLQAVIAGHGLAIERAHGSTSSPRTDTHSSLQTGGKNSPGTEFKSRVTKTYCANVEGAASDAQMTQLTNGVTLNDGVARAISARVLRDASAPWPRDPPIRVRPSVPDSWIELALDEGRNRQVRRMTSAVGLPTLRLIRVAIGPWRVDGLQLGESRVMSDDAAFAALRDG